MQALALLTTGERLVDFMRDGSGQFTHGRHACHMSEFRLRLMQLVLCANELPLGKISEREYLWLKTHNHALLVRTNYQNAISSFKKGIPRFSRPMMRSAPRPRRRVRCLTRHAPW